MPSKTKQSTNKLFLDALFVIVYLTLAYVFIALAIDSGSYWHYGLAFLSLGMSINTTIRIIKNRVNGRKK